MSKFTQIDIRMVSAYGSKGFDGCFPNLAKFLHELGYGPSLEDDPDLYHLVEVLERIDRDPGVSKQHKVRIRPFLPKLSKLRDRARNSLLSRSLGELDRLLYLMEDEYSDLEKELSW